MIQVWFVSSLRFWMDKESQMCECISVCVCIMWTNKIQTSLSHLYRLGNSHLPRHLLDGTTLLILETTVWRLRRGILGVPRPVQFIRTTRSQRNQSFTSTMMTGDHSCDVWHLMHDLHEIHYHHIRPLPRDWKKIFWWNNFITARFWTYINYICYTIQTFVHM